MWRTYIYRLLYIFFHCAYTVFEYIQSALENVLTKIVDFYHEFWPTAEKNKHLLEVLQKISKKPAHLTVLLGHEEPSYKDLANLIIWCMATRISFISFYDCKGILKKNQDELQYEVNRRKNKEDHVIWHSDSVPPYKNGFIGKNIHVKIITEEEGKLIVNLAKNMLLSKNRDFSVDNISISLSKKFEFPNPDMGLYCDRTLRLYNYPPWQISVTEFFRIKSLCNISFSCFVEQLVKYSKCEQRLGK